MDYYSLNRVILIGYVGKVPEVRISKPSPGVKTPRKMAKFQLSTRTISRKAEKPRTMWHNCYAWGARADFVEKYVKAGSLLLIEGKLENYVMKDADGQSRKHLYVCIDTVGFMPAAKIREPAAAADVPDEDGSLPEGSKDPIDKGNPFL